LSKITRPKPQTRIAHIIKICMNAKSQTNSYHICTPRSPKPSSKTEHTRSQKPSYQGSSPSIITRNLLIDAQMDAYISIHKFFSAYLCAAKASLKKYV